MSSIEGKPEVKIFTDLGALVAKAELHKRYDMAQKELFGKEDQIWLGQFVRRAYDISVEFPATVRDHSPEYKKNLVILRSTKLVPYQTVTTPKGACPCLHIGLDSKADESKGKGDKAKIEEITIVGNFLDKSGKPILFSSWTLIRIIKLNDSIDRKDEWRMMEPDGEVAWPGSKARAEAMEMVKWIRDSLHAEAVLAAKEALPQIS